LVPRSLAIAAGLCTLYVACFVSVDAIVAASVPAAGGPQLGWFVAAVVTVGFAAMFALQIHLQSVTGLASMTRWRVHASNGFYIENALRRVFGPLATS
jgi:NAD(P)H-quinone oxidoreductase subunit 5